MSRGARRFIATAAIAVAAFSAFAAPARAVDGGLPSEIVLLSDHSTPVKTWSEVPLRARLQTLDGTPLPGRTVRVWDDSYMRWHTCCGPPPSFTTDANGEIRWQLYPDGNSDNPVRVAVYWHGDSVHAKAINEFWQPVIGYDTTLDVTHASSRTGQALPVTVTVRRTDPAASSTGCIDDAVVSIMLTGPETRTATAVVQHDPFAGTCKGTAEFGADLTPGVYTLSASTGHEGWRRTDEPRAYAAPVDIRWQHVFSDASGRGTVSVQLASKQYRVTLADGRDSGIRFAGSGITRTGVSGTVSVWRIDLSHSDADDHATGAFYSTGSFSAAGTLSGGAWELSR